MVRSLVVFTCVAVAAFAQTCSNAGNGGCVNGICMTGFTCVNGGTVCCANANVVNCADKLNPNTGVSDCPRMASYCTNSAYRILMADQCPKTCNLCTTVSTTTAASTCVDKINPNTGRSDCPRMAAYCNNSSYRTLMQQECRKTCGFC